MILKLYTMPKVTFSQMQYLEFFDNTCLITLVQQKKYKN